MHTDEKFPWNPSWLNMENGLWCKGLHVKPILALNRLYARPGSRE
jgi:hypothetical protein